MSSPVCSARAITRERSGRHVGPLILLMQAGPLNTGSSRMIATTRRPHISERAFARQGARSLPEANAAATVSSRAVMQMTKLEVVMVLDNTGSMGKSADGSRGGTLRDPFGHRWMVGTHVREVAAEEYAKARDDFSRTTVS